jgi:flagellar basal-body rod protein FlgC
MKTVSSETILFRGNIYRSMEISASGMTSQRMKMDAVASNIANISTTNADGAGNPYLRRQVLMQPAPKQTFAANLKNAMLQLKRTRPDHILASQFSVRTELTPEVMGRQVEIPNMKKNVVYDPTHPDADKEGFVVYPDVNMVEEMVDLMVAGRAFEANVTVINAAKSMIMKSLEI